MKQLALIFAGALIAGLLPAAFVAAQQPTPTTPPATPPARGKRYQTTTTTTHTANSVHGIVKGAPQGSSFTVARRGGAVTVDASGATFKSRGQPATIADVKGGAIVTAHGSMQGNVFKATDVTVFPRGARKKRTTTTTTTTTTPPHP